MTATMAADATGRRTVRPRRGPGGRSLLHGTAAKAGSLGGDPTAGVSTDGGSAMAVMRRGRSSLNIRSGARSLQGGHGAVSRYLAVRLVTVQLSPPASAGKQPEIANFITQTDRHSGAGMFVLAMRPARGVGFRSEPPPGTRPERGGARPPPLLSDPGERVDDERHRGRLG